MPQLNRWSALRSRYSPGVADTFFIGATLVVFSCRGSGMMDDPGLGWHLRIPDRMWELGGFIRQEPFCVVSEGAPYMAFSWLGDILFRLAFAWAGLNGVGAITSLTLAISFRTVLSQIIRDGVPWVMAVAWSCIVVLGTKPYWTARPNVFSFVGLAFTLVIAHRFHKGQISRPNTLWLILLFLIWANAHGGFLGGAFVLAVTYVVECYLALAAKGRNERSAARQRLVWWTFMGFALVTATLANPYGFGLYQWLSRFSDPFIQRSSTVEWLPTDFTASGFGTAEALLLALPLLLAVSRRKAGLLELVLSIVWLHFALGTVRYVGMWVIVVAPLLASLSCHVPWYFHVVDWARSHTSSRFQERFENPPMPNRYRASIGFAILFLMASRWLPNVSAHRPDNIPTQALDYVLESYEGERVFHSANWGGYLTCHGWDLQPRFRTWIDDRIDVHGQANTEEYFALMRAEGDWQAVLDKRRIEVLCLPIESRLAMEVSGSATWEENYRDDHVAIFRRVTSL